MTDPLPDPGRRKDKDDLHDQARREASANSAQTPGADYLTDENGNTTAIRSDTISKGFEQELHRGEGQDNISARPAKRRASDPEITLPPLDDDATQMKKIEEAAGLAPGRPGDLEEKDARTLPTPPIVKPH